MGLKIESVSFPHLTHAPTPAQNYNMGITSPALLPNRRITLLYYAPLAGLPFVILTIWATVGIHWPRWLLMWAVAVGLFTGCKWLTWRSADLKRVQIWRQTAYLFLWPGLDAEAFFGNDKNASAKPPKINEWLLAIFNLFWGLLLFWVLARQWPVNWPLLRGWTGMTGFIFAAHCGAFNLLSCLWRSFGVDARPLMDWPLRSCSLSEFWGKRWNTAFRDLSHRFLFSPLARRLGPRVGLAAGFVFSGAVHELAVTIPAGGGYGGPTFFFSLQGMAILLERSRMGRSFGLGRGWRGWVFTMFVIVLPVGIAFPPVFVENIILPWMKALGAL